MRTLSRGFSLIEIVFAMLIIGVLISSGIVYLKGGVASADSHSLALITAETLRVARQSAIASQEPVAVMFPTNNGSTPLSQSLYIATGLSMAHVRSVSLLANQQSPVSLFAGIWPVSSGSFITYPALPDQRYAGPTNPFPFPKWFTNPNLGGYPIAADYALIFQPDGSVSSNGLPFHSNGSKAGAYYLVASAGATVQTASAPTPAMTFPAGAATLSYFQLLGIGQPWAVGITPSGEISVTSGLPGLASGTVQVFESTLPSSGTYGVAPAVTVMPAGNPSGTVVMTPTCINSSTLPAGVNTTIAPGQRLSLAVNATDGSGQDLYIQWTATPSGANNPATSPAAGTFSYGAPQRMSWDNLNQIWTASWDWECPVNAAQGDQWTFSCSFSNSTSAMVPYGPLSQNVFAVQQGHLWVGWMLPDSSHQLWKMNIDGTGAVLFHTWPNSVTPALTSVSSDGQFVSVLLNGPAPTLQLLSGMTGQVIAQNSPKLPTALLSVISPRGDKFATAGIPSGTGTAPLSGPGGGVWMSDFNGNAVQLWQCPTGATPTSFIWNLAWSPDETKIAVGIWWNQPVSPTWATWIVDVTHPGAPAQPVPMACPAGGYCRSTNLMWDITSRYLFYDDTQTYASGAWFGWDFYKWDTQTQTLTSDGNPYTNSNQAIGGGQTYDAALSPDNTRFYFFNNSSFYGIGWIANQAGASTVTQVPFAIPSGCQVISVATSK